MQGFSGEEEFSPLTNVKYENENINKKPK